MDLGAFSVSLAVKDLDVSRAFCEQDVDSYTDVRELRAELKAKGVNFVAEGDGPDGGPGSFIVVDPDGNQILIDQHRQRPLDRSGPSAHGIGNPTSSVDSVSTHHI